MHWLKKKKKIQKAQHIFIFSSQLLRITVLIIFLNKHKYVFIIYYFIIDISTCGCIFPTLETDWPHLGVMRMDE